MESLVPTRIFPKDFSFSTQGSLACTNNKWNQKSNDSQKASSQFTLQQHTWWALQRIPTTSDPRTFLNVSTSLPKKIPQLFPNCTRRAVNSLCDKFTYAWSWLERNPTTTDPRNLVSIFHQHSRKELASNNQRNQNSEESYQWIQSANKYRHTHTRSLQEPIPPSRSLLHSRELNTVDSHWKPQFHPYPRWC